MPEEQPPQQPYQPPPDGNYSNIREVLGALIGRTIIEITQHDKDEWKETRQSYFCLHFDNGATMTIPINDAAVTLEWPGTDCDSSRGSRCNQVRNPSSSWQPTSSVRNSGSTTKT